MAFPVTVVNPPSRPVPVDVTKQPIQVSPTVTTIQSFTYAIQPLGNQPNINFGFVLSSDSVLETIAYYSATSPVLILTMYFHSWAPPAVLGAVQGATIVPQPDARFHFVLSPAAGTSVIAFTTVTNINITQTRIDIDLSTPNSANIPASAAGALTFQFHQRY